MVNILIELGHKLMSQAWNDSTNPTVIIDKNEIVESFKKHFFNAELKEEAVGDQVAEIIFKKLIEQSSSHNERTQPTNTTQHYQHRTTKTLTESAKETTKQKLHHITEQNTKEMTTNEQTKTNLTRAGRL